MNKTQILIGNLTIEEPATMITDLIVATICLFAFTKLYKGLNRDKKHEKLYLHFFFCMGMCTLFGALMTHAFGYYFLPSEYANINDFSILPWTEQLKMNLYKLPNWIFNISSVTFFAYASISRADEILNIKNKKLIYLLTAIETIIIISLTLYKFTFLFAEIHIGISLLIFSAPFQIKIWKKYQKPDAKFILLATLITTFVPGIMIPKLCINQWFNYNDISHVFISCAMISFYIAGLYWIKEYESDTENQKLELA
ncbi:MAG: hypothetical protein MJ211_01695 [Bacteroidales bacterium]|nr:hypothetical protein [Bacteroidales bacterium]